MKKNTEKECKKEPRRIMTRSRTAQAAGMQVENNDDNNNKKTVLLSFTRSIKFNMQIKGVCFWRIS